MEKLTHSNNDMARAILRSAIATTNNQLINILTQMLPNAALICNNSGEICMCDYFNNNETFNEFSATLKTINDAFFYSPMNKDNNKLMSQGYYIASFPGNLVNYIEEAQISPDVNIPIDPIFKLILHAKHEADIARNEHYQKMFDEGKISLTQAHKQLQKAYNEFDITPFEGVLMEYGYAGKDLLLAKTFLTIAATGKKNTRIVDYLDVYSLYHYYIFRKRINRRFLKEIELKRYNRSQVNALFEKIVKEEVALHCNQEACEANTYFDRKYMTMCSDAMNASRAKNISLDIFNAGKGACEKAAGIIELIINISTPSYDRIKIDNIYMSAK